MVFFGIALGLLALTVGTPIFLAFVLGAGVPLFHGLGIPLSSLSNLCVGSLDKYVLLAIPLFIVAGHLMVSTGVAKQMIDLFTAFLGHVHGGLAMVAVAACAFFGACSGSALAVHVAVGSILIPVMVEHGYARSYASGLIAVSALLGLIIPPSNGFIIYGAITGVSVAKLFMAGLIPGLFITGAFMVYVYFSCRGKFATLPKRNWAQRRAALISALPALSVPLVVLGGIYGGVFTPTESAAVACALAVVVGLIYRKVTWTGLWRALVKAAEGSALIFILISTAIFLSAMFTYFKIPHMVTAWATSQGLTYVSFMLLAALIYLALGCILEAVPISYIAYPILCSVAQTLQVDPYLFGVFSVAMVGIGQITPPVGVGLFTAAAIANEPIPVVLRASMPFFFLWVALAIVIAMVPELSTFLPNLMSS